ncbi:MAG: hypothetical protein HWE14_00830 [Flavobacteriia bacterium]|nr:hypothetical protein [Flavobacteriia bacterium]
MKLSLLAILLSLLQTLHAQPCDSLKTMGVTLSFPINQLEILAETDCPEAKLTLAYELLRGFRIQQDSSRAIQLLEECLEDDIDCKYELFKVYYESTPSKAYSLITEIALIDTLTNYWDSAMVHNAMLIAADMSERKLGNNDGPIISAAWHLLSYDLAGIWPDDAAERERANVRLVLSKLSSEDLDGVYQIAKRILGRDPSLERTQFDK